VAEVSAWCREILERSPTAIAVAKRSFNADSDNIAGIAAMGLQALNRRRSVGIALGARRVELTVGRNL
jgi:1,4-dihydroxy-2-naphthoyl-CoA synthase